MPQYSPPLDDMRFILREMLPEEGLGALPGAGEHADDVVEAVLEEAAKLCTSVLHPLNRSGDEEGCVYENGVVRAPRGFKEAYAQFAAGGWTGLAARAEFGGQGLPATVDTFVTEMLCSSNLSFCMYPALSHGAYKLIAAHGSDAQKRRFLPGLVDGRWSGTMCLTEPQCGTDLGLVRTRAVPDGDGAWRLSGTKIFISAGDHDLTENILHLVLARTPDAPPGTRGLSVFLVPKFLVAEDGSVGARNGVTCTGIEKKMGIHASATCTLAFDDAAAHLVGGLNDGMRAMFTMMNGARLAVALHGLGIAEAAYQASVAWARERRQGRAASGAREPDEAADPIIVHADVRRMLLDMRTRIEASRALAAMVAARLEQAGRNPDAHARRAADEFVSLMTPVVKASFTDMGSAAANLAVQVHGGHGYVRDNGIEQLVRDARICQIYEGTNGVQAMDLVGRKLGAHTGRYLRRFFHPLAQFIDSRAGEEPMAEFIEPLSRALRTLQKVTAWMALRGGADADEAAAGASEYLRLFALVAMAWMWARMAEVALARGDDPFHRAKVDSARYFMQRVLPECGSLAAAITAGGGTIMGFDQDAF